MIKAAVTIKKPQKQIVTWFKTLKDKPDQYRFSSHQGVRVVKGSLDKPGGVFETKERFGGLLPLGLRFQITQVKANSFTFKLIKPLKSLRIYGQFVVRPVSARQSRLTLRIFGKRQQSLMVKTGQILMFNWPVSQAVKQQIQAEVIFIRKAIEKN